MTPKKKILIVDDESYICGMLSAFLSQKYEVQSTTVPDHALALCDQIDFNLIISDINMPAMSGLELLAKIRAKHPAKVFVLMTGYNVNDYLQQTLEYNLSNIISKTVPFNFIEIQILLDALLTESIFGLNRYLLGDGLIMNSFSVRSTQEAQQVRDTITGMFSQMFGTAGDMNLILDEIITNALYHAPANPDGTQKYEAYESINLDKNEFVQVDCGADSEKYGVSVSDSSGRLTKKKVLETVHRQVSGQGLLDDHGRGIHISRLFSDRMIINIKPGSRTEVILMNYFTQKYQGYKPFYINELQPDRPPQV
jgi:CheY-like chemotaxis protein